MWDLSLDYSKFVWQRSQNPCCKQTIVSLNFENRVGFSMRIIYKIQWHKCLWLRKVDNRVRINNIRMILDRFYHSGKKKTLKPNLNNTMHWKWC
jgi:hypothetical protein